MQKIKPVCFPDNLHIYLRCTHVTGAPLIHISTNYHALFPVFLFLYAE